MHFNGLKLSGALEEFSITLRFLGSEMQKSIFEENTRLIAFFFKLKHRRLQTHLADLKNTKILRFLLMTD